MAPPAKAAAAPSHNANHTDTGSPEEAVQPGATLPQIQTFSHPTLQQVSHFSTTSANPTVIPQQSTPQSGSVATDHKQAAATSQVLVGRQAATAEAGVHGGHSGQSSQASRAAASQAQLPDPTARLHPAPLRTTLYQLRNHSQSRGLPSGLGSMRPASLDYQHATGATPGAVAAADHSDEVSPSCSDAAARTMQPMAISTSLDQSVSTRPSASDHPLYDQQGSDSCTSDKDVGFGSPSSRAPDPTPPRRIFAQAVSPPSGFEHVTHDHLYDEHESDSTSSDDSATQNLLPHVRVLRRNAASAASPPPGFEDVVPQPRFSQDSEATAGPSQMASNAEPGSNHADCACGRSPRPDGSHRHITEKGKRRQKRRALLRKQARLAQRSQSGVQIT